MINKLFIRIIVVMLVMLVAQQVSAMGVRKLKEENARLKTELNSAQSRISELEAQHAGLESELGSKKRELQEVYTQYEMRMGELQELETRLEAKNRELLELQEQYDLKSLERDQLHDQIDVKNSELQRLYDEVQALETTSKELGDTLKAKGDELQKEISRLSSKRQELEKQIASLKSDIDASRKRNERLNQTLGDYKTKINEQTLELRNLKTERERLKKSVDNLSSSLKAKTDELSKQVAQLTSQKQNLEDQIALLQRETDARLVREAADRERMKSAYEQLLASLNQEISQKTIEVQEYRDALTINIMDKIFFDSGKADIKPGGYDVLRKVSGILKELPDKVIRIEGHTDDVPIGQKIMEKYPSNWELGAARAARVAEFFREEGGIDPSRIVIVSYSMYRPLVPHTTRDNRAKNRRIEIVVHDKLYYQMVELQDSIKK